MSDGKHIVISNLTCIPQAYGYGMSVQDVLLTVNVASFVAADENRQFLVELTITVNNDQYMFTNLIHPEDIDDAGDVHLGTIYLPGPFNEEDLIYEATYQFVSSNA